MESSSFSRICIKTAIDIYGRVTAGDKTQVLSKGAISTRNLLGRWVRCWAPSRLIKLVELKTP